MRHDPFDEGPAQLPGYARRMAANSFRDEVIAERHDLHGDQHQRIVPAMAGAAWLHHGIRHVRSLESTAWEPP
jgi:hypothetical protein